MNNNGELVVSALRGGAAEVVLRAMCHGVTDSIIRLGFPWIEATPGIFMAEGLLRLVSQSNADVKALFVIGGKKGLYLEDAPLTQNRHICLNQYLGAYGADGDVDYVIRIGKSILQNGATADNPAVRRVANQICAFLIANRHDRFAAIKKSALSAEADRLVRAQQHKDAHLVNLKARNDRKYSRSAEKSVASCAGA